MAMSLLTPSGLSGGSSGQFGFRSRRIGYIRSGGVVAFFKASQSRPFIHCAHE
jgi:hypothetical protein